MNRRSLCQTNTCVLTLFVLGLLVLSPTNLLCLDRGFKLIRNYSYMEYDHTAQNWAVVQDRRGVLYFANHAGILEYDGVSWKVHYIEGSGQKVRSLAIDPSGTVFAGGENSQIWRLAPDSTGTMRLTSLSRFLDEEYREFDTVYGTHIVQNKVYFRSQDSIFVWDRQKMTVLTPVSRFKASFVHGDDLLVQDEEKGLLKLVNDTLVPVPGGTAFGVSRISMFTPFGGVAGENTFLMGNRDSELSLYKDGTLIPFQIQTEAQDYIDRYMLNHGIRLSSGDFALATQKGLVIIGPGGELISILDRDRGLQDDVIKFVFQDTWGNLWLCLEIGISKIEYHSPFLFVKSNVSLPGLIQAVVRHKNDLYIGTTRGIFYMRENHRFQKIPGISDPCNALVSFAGHLLAATDDGVYLVNRNRPQKITDRRMLSLSASKHYPGLLWCGAQDALLAFEKRKGQWREKLTLEIPNHGIHSIAEGEDDTLWLGTPGEIVFKIRFTNGFGQPEISTLGPGQGLPGGESYVAEAAGQVVVGTSKGLFRFDSAANRFIPYPLLGREFAGGELSEPVFRIIEDFEEKIWFSSGSRNYLAVPGLEGRYGINHQPFRRMPLVQTNAIYPDPLQKITWFSRHDGLFGFDHTLEKNYRQPFRTLIRRIILNESSGNPIDLPFNGQGKSADASPVPHIEFKNRSIYFEYAAPFFEAENETRYQCLLEGYDPEWTTWSKESNRNYTNLSPGDYRFRVRAKNIFGTSGQEDEFRFRILNPWYGTWWMYLVYILLSAFLIYLLVRGRSFKLEKDKKRLESVVNERTREINQKNRQLLNQAEKLKEMDNVKSRFFANISHEFRTPLTLIQGPLEQMYSESGDRDKRKRISSMLRSSRRLLNLINQLLDLSRLDSGKEKLLAANLDIVSFLKGVTAAFETMAEQKKLNLTFFSEEDEIALYFDSQKMERVMSNLLINAVKFTPPHGNVTVSIYKRLQEQEPAGEPHNFVYISVKDSGAGIPLDQIDSIFDRFFQVERTEAAIRQGTGIGLALVKEYVELHHGNIDLHTLEGKGTEFVLRFPTGHDHLEPGEITGSPTIVPVSALTISEVEADFDWDVNHEDTGANGTRDEAGEQGTGEKPVILVVEDNTEMRRYICDPLQAEYSVVEAVDGNDGIKRANDIIPDLIVSDIMMPGTDGYQLCRGLKKDIRTSHIPIILLTAKASEESIVQGLETGADDYITKPFNTQILLTRIKNLIDMRRQLQLKIQKQMLLQPDEITVSSMDREFIDDLKAAIDANISDSDFRVEALSDKMFMVRTTLYRKINALTGQSPQIFLRSYRLQKAAQYLKQQAGTVSQVASRVGFDNFSYFSKCFKEEFKMEPSLFMSRESGPNETKPK